MVTSSARSCECGMTEDQPFKTKWWTISRSKQNDEQSAVPNKMMNNQPFQTKWWTLSCSRQNDEQSAVPDKMMNTQPFQTKWWIISRFRRENRGLYIRSQDCQMRGRYACENRSLNTFCRNQLKNVFENRCTKIKILKTFSCASKGTFV